MRSNTSLTLQDGRNPAWEAAVGAGDWLYARAAVAVGSGGTGETQGKRHRARRCAERRSEAESQAGPRTGQE